MHEHTVYFDERGTRDGGYGYHAYTACGAPVTPDDEEAGRMSTAPPRCPACLAERAERAAGYARDAAERDARAAEKAAEKAARERARRERLALRSARRAEQRLALRRKGKLPPPPQGWAAAERNVADHYYRAQRRLQERR